MKSISEKKQMIAAAELKLARLRQEINRQARTTDTRRKILLGSYLLACTKNDPLLFKNLSIAGLKLDDFLSRESDRSLFSNWNSSALETETDLIKGS